MTRFEEHELDLRIEDASSDALEQLRTMFGWDDGGLKDRLRERGLLSPAGYLTVAGAAYLLDDPSEVLGKAYVEIL